MSLDKSQRPFWPPTPQSSLAGADTCPRLSRPPPIPEMHDSLMRKVDEGLKETQACPSFLEMKQTNPKLILSPTKPNVKSATFL